METTNVKIILDVLGTIWCGQFKLNRDPSELCPNCLKQGDLNYMIPSASKVLGRNFTAFPTSAGIAGMKQSGMNLSTEIRSQNSERRKQ